MTPSEQEQLDDPRFLRRIPPIELPIAPGADQGQPTTPRMPIAKGAVTAMSPSAQGIAAKPLPVALPVAPVQSENAKRLAELQTQGPRIPRIHNPFLRTLATVGDVLAGTFAPRAEQLIPGTQGNYNMRLGRQTSIVNEEEALKNAQQKRLLEAAQAEKDLRAPPGNEAGTVHEDSEGNYWVIHPNGDATQVTPKGQPLKGKLPAEEKGGTVHEDADGNMWVVKGDGTAVPVRPKTENVPLQTVPTQLKGKPPAKPIGPEGELQLGERVPQINQAMTHRYQVLHAGQSLPQEYTLPTNATQKDADRIDKLMEAEERAVATKAQQDEIAAMRKQTFAATQENRRDTQTTKAYDNLHKQLTEELTPVNTQLESVQEARRLINSGAVGQALGTIKTLVAVAGGRGSGVRITQAELNSIPAARGITGGFEGLMNQLMGRGRLSAQQVTEVNNILGSIEEIASHKQDLLNGTLDKAAGAGSVQELRKVEQDYRHAQSAASKMAAVGGKTYSQSDVDEFVKAGHGTAKQFEDSLKAKGWTKQ